MKKSVFIIMALGCIAACNKFEAPVEPAAGEGAIVLNVGSDNSLVVTKAVSAVSDLSGFYVKIDQGAANRLPATLYGNVSSWTYPVSGGDYTVTVYNYNPAVADFAAGDKGSARYMGSDTKGLTANAVTTFNIACGTQKTAQATVAFGASLDGVFKDLEVEIYASGKEGRKFTYTKGGSADPVFYVTEGGNPQIIYTVKGLKESDAAGTALRTLASNAASPISVAAAHRLVLNIGADASNGQIAVNVTFDDTVTVDNSEVTLNPYI